MERQGCWVDAPWVAAFADLCGLAIEYESIDSAGVRTDSGVFTPWDGTPPLALVRAVLLQDEHWLAAASTEQRTSMGDSGGPPDQPPKTPAPSAPPPAPASVPPPQGFAALLAAAAPSQGPLATALDSALAARDEARVRRIIDTIAALARPPLCAARAPTFAELVHEHAFATWFRNPVNDEYYGVEWTILWEAAVGGAVLVTTVDGASAAKTMARLRHPAAACALRPAFVWVPEERSFNEMEYAYPARPVSPRECCERLPQLQCDLPQMERLGEAGPLPTACTGPQHSDEAVRVGLYPFLPFGNVSSNSNPVVPNGALYPKCSLAPNRTSALAQQALSVHGVAVPFLVS